LTKLHEEVIRGTASEVADELSRRDILGEVVVVLEGATLSEVVEDEAVVAALVEQWSEGVTTRDAVDYVSKMLGVPHRDVYQLALAARKDASTK
jgi:16S rRNA (cytidine1402-2'-O)-methyltransferase